MRVVTDRSSIAVLFCALACGGAPQSKRTEEPKAQAAPTASAEAPTVERPKANPTAIALLDDYIAFARGLAAQAQPEPQLAALDELEVRARSEGTSGSISETFTRRYLRLVTVTRLLISPLPQDMPREKAIEELDRFAKDVSGRSLGPDTDRSFATLSPVFVDEVVRLHGMVDGTGSTDAARKKYSSARP